MSVSFRQAQHVWARIGLLSFGGPAGQIALIHRETVAERQWIDEREFLSALNFCMLLPGPEAMQLATYIGWKMHGVKGGLLAGLLFVIPGSLVLLALSITYHLFGSVPAVAGIFWGIKAAVLAIVFEALLRVGKRALKTPSDFVIAAASFIALFVFAIAFPLVIFGAGAVGYFFLAQNNPADETRAPLPPFSTTLKTTGLWLVIWLLPLLLLQTAPPVYAELGVFFSKLAVVTFGGAYAVLSYMGQAAVETHGWLSTAQVMDGLGLAETTPGPLILVGQFVGFLAAAQTQKTMLAGVIGSVIFLWMTFVPCFLWIFAGAPYLNYLQSLPRISKALSCITAAVAGVILNLALWFGLHVLFAQVARLKGAFPLWWPEPGSFNPAAFGVAALSMAALLWFKAGIPKTLALGAALGLGWSVLVPLI